MAWVTVASDNFNRANGSVGSNWTTLEIGVNAGGLLISNNTAIAGGASWNFSGSYYTAATPLANQRISAKVTQSVGIGYWYEMYIRWRGAAAGGPAGYYAQFDGGGGTNLMYRYQSGASNTILNAGAKAAILANTYVRMSAVGSTISVETSGDRLNWTTRMSVTDTNIPSGGTGGLFIQNAGFAWDDMIIEEEDAGRSRFPLPSFKG